MPNQNITKEHNQKTFAGCLVLFIFLIVCIFLQFSGCGEIERSSFDKVHAKIMVESYIKKQLRSPSTADFGMVRVDDVITQIDDTTFLAGGYVDSQNGFGAIVRTKYSCKVIYHPATKMVNFELLMLK